MKNIQKTLQSIDPVYWVILCITILSVVAFWNTNNEITRLTQENQEQDVVLSSLYSTLASSTSLLTENIEETKLGFSNALEQEKQNVSLIKEQLGGFENTVGDISGTVNTLEKLSKTDPELLQKYSKVFFLNEHYIPERLIQIKNDNKYSDSRDLQVQVSIRPYLEEMLTKALADNVEIYVASAYRSFETQQHLKGQYSLTYGAGTANQFSADQGYSEHQLGTTVDLIALGLGGQLDGFENTEAYTWLLANAHNYGFALSYPEDNAFYIFEPWHWRFVGVELATHLYDTKQNFYDLDQRDLDLFLVNIFD